MPNLTEEKLKEQLLILSSKEIDEQYEALFISQITIVLLQVISNNS